tara:strand:- start:681 stop:1550 length:870 start_codon:yes stop_codon:yes gene_type:complete
MKIDNLANKFLERIAIALEKIAPKDELKNEFNLADGYVWQADRRWLEPVDQINRVDITLLQGIDRQIALLLENTERFSKQLPANNALLWGARGSGKSSLVKAAHAEVNRNIKDVSSRIALIEIHREDIPTLPNLLAILRETLRPCLVFCDDLSFDGEDASYKSLKALLEGGIEGRPKNVIFYATSNRRHLLPRDMMENEQSTSINPSEAVEEKVSLSDRFGLWLGFHNCTQETYLTMVKHYIEYFELETKCMDWKKEANEWAVTRGARSGRVAWQYIQDLAGRLGKSLN